MDDIAYKAKAGDRSSYEVINYLFSGTKPAMYAGSVVALLLVAGTWGSSSAPASIAWLILIEAVVAFRLHLNNSFQRHKLLATNTSAWLTKFRLGAFASGAAWGLGTYLFFIPNDIVRMALISMFVAGIAAGGVMVYVVDWVTVASFALPLVLPLILLLLSEDTYESLIMNAAVIAFLTYILAGTRATRINLLEKFQLHINAVKREEALGKQNKFLHTILEYEPECVKVISTDGELLQMNRAGLEMVEVDSVEQARSIGEMNFLLPEFRQPYERLFQKVSSGVPGKLEFQIRGNKGTLRWLETHAAPLFDAHGAVESIIGVTRDITESKQSDLLLKASEEKWRMLFTNMPTGFALHEVICDENGVPIDYRWLEVNPEFEKMLGLKAENIIGHTVLEILPDTEQYWITTFGKVALSREAVSYENYSQEFGKWFQVRAFSPKHMQFAVMVTDITELKKADMETRIAATAFESREGMLITDAEVNILRVNSAFTNITGYAAEEVIGKNPRILSSGRQNKAFYAQMWGSLNTRGMWEGEIWNRRKNGEIYPEWLNITAVRDENGATTNYVASMSDITARKNAEEEVYRLAFYDPLTNLANRRLLLDRLQRALAYSSRTRQYGALLFIDLDNFKVINDTLGHTHGDELLREVARRLSSCVREGDTVARLGGDEFVVMLENLQGHTFEASEQAKNVADKVMESIRRVYELGKNGSYCTPSVGIALFSGHEQTSDEILQQADIAMYEAKKAGRNTVRFFDHAMQAAISARATLEGELRAAFEHQQFELYYQVQKTHTGKTVGAETLIRWNHPSRGMVPPGDFIPVLEESGLIIPVGAWIVDTACAQLKAWERNPGGTSLTLSVNVSANQFHQQEFVQLVRDAVGRHEINPGRLKLELTESIVLEDIESTVRVMNQLSDIGVHLSLDDFGTGYSSLQYLKHLPLDQLKIDQSFVNDITTDLSDLAIVRTIVAVSESLGLDIIAEGVETEEQKKLLFRSGCNHFQGYLYGRPMPLGEFETTYLKQRT